MTERIYILLVADDPLARAGLAMLLSTEPAFELSDQVSSVMVDTDLLDETPLDVIVWDLGWETAVADLPDIDDLGLPVIALIADPQETAVVWSTGVRALLLRDMDGNKLAQAIHAVTAGLLVIDPALAGALVPDSIVDEQELVTAVTPREQEVLQLLAEGLTNKAIAMRLNISDHTVKFHVNAIMSKLNAQSRTAAVVRATRLGLIAL